MTQETDSPQTPHPNPFTLAQIQRFYRQNGIPVKITSGRNLYVLHKDGKPWVRIAYRQEKKEWFLDSWQPQSMIVPFWQHKTPHTTRLNCWCREENHLQRLEHALEMTLELLE